MAGIGTTADYCNTLASLSNQNQEGISYGFVEHGKSGIVSIDRIVSGWIGEQVHSTRHRTVKSKSILVS